MANPGLFLSVYILFKHNIYRKTVGFSGIQTRIVGIEDKHAYHHHGPNSGNFYYICYCIVKRSENNLELAHKKENNNNYLQSISSLRNELYHWIQSLRSIDKALKVSLRDVYIKQMFGLKLKVSHNI